MYVCYSACGIAVSEKKSLWKISTSQRQELAAWWKSNRRKTKTRCFLHHSSPCFFTSNAVEISMVDENQEHKQSDEAETIKMGGEDSHKHCALSIKSLFSPFFDILALWFISLSEKKKKSENARGNKRQEQQQKRHLHHGERASLSVEQTLQVSESRDQQLLKQERSKNRKEKCSTALLSEKKKRGRKKEKTKMIITIEKGRKKNRYFS